MRTPWPSRSGSRARRSIPARNAARVFPDPVGAQIRAFLPDAIAGQPLACAGVGASKDASNQPRTGGENSARGSSPVVFRSVANPSILRIGRVGPVGPGSRRRAGYRYFFFGLNFRANVSVDAWPKSSVIVAVTVALPFLPAFAAFLSALRPFLGIVSVTAAGTPASTFVVTAGIANLFAFDAEADLGLGFGALPDPC